MLKVRCVSLLAATATTLIVAASLEAGVILYDANVNPNSMDGYVTESGSQTWIKGASGATGTPVTESDGTLAWSVADGNNNQWLIYNTTTDAANAGTKGWTLSCKYMVPSSNSTYTHEMKYGTSTNGVTLRIGSYTSSGYDSKVRLYYGASYATNSNSIFVAGAVGTYHTAKVAYSSGSVNVYVDNTKILSNIAVTTDYTNAYVAWGDYTGTSSGPTVNYSHILWEGGDDTLGSGTVTLPSFAAGTTNLLKGGKTSLSTTVGNASGTASDNINWSVTGDMTGSGVVLGAGATTNASGSYTGSSYGSQTLSVAVSATNCTLGTSAGSASSSVTINVGQATVGSNHTFGTALTGALAANESLAGLASKTTADSVNGVLGTEATIVGGLASSAGTASEAWRTRNDSDIADKIVSDVLSLSTPTGANGFLLAMSYNETNLGTLPENSLCLGWLNDSSEWVNAVEGNTITGSSATTGYVGSLSALLASAGVTEANITDYIGSWGVDTGANIAWAVVNHNSEFGVMTPEPSSITILTAGLLGLIAYAWRRRR